MEATKEKAIRLIKENKMSFVYLKQINYPHFGGTSDLYINIKVKSNKLALRLVTLLKENNINATILFDYDFYPFNKENGKKFCN